MKTDQFYRLPIPQPGEGVTILLPKGFRPGRHINWEGNVYRIERHGRDMSCFPGGTGSVECEMVKVQDGWLTERELQQLDKGNP